MLFRRVFLQNCHRVPVVTCRTTPFMSTGGFRNFAVSAAQVKELRGLTGSPLKDCMAALEENNGDIEASKDYLRKKGLAAAEKKMDRVAAEGLVGVLQDPAK